VAANQAIRERLRHLLPAELPLHVPPPILCTDNGAMIAAAGYYRRAEAVAPAAGGPIQPNLALPV
jgi:tRNA A37 threonylcarbamoyltransferase TsaD